ncbi:MAG: tetratricopeptide repeat protein [Pseudomonadota bacterium]
MTSRIVSLASGAVLALLAGVASIPASAQGIAGSYLAARQAEARGDISEAARLYSETLARDSQNEPIMERTMIHQIAAGLVPDGIALARRYEGLNPGHHLGVLALATDAFRKKDAAGALKALGSGSTFVGQVMAAWADYGNGDLVTAREKLTALEASEENGRPGQIVAAYHLGLLEAAAGDDEAAVLAYERTMDLSNGGTLRLAELRARALTRLDRKDEAITVIEERLASTYGNIGLSLLAEQIQAGEAMPVLVDSAEKGASEVLFGVSGLLARGRNRLIALAYSRLAVHLHDDLTEAKLLIAQILDQDAQYELAVAAYAAIPDTSPESLNARIGKAEAIQAAGRIDEAVTEMRSTIDTYPDAIEAHTALGDMLRRESRFEEASSAYDGAVKLLPSIETHHWALFYQRGITFERSKEWDKAEADFRKALELKPDQPEVLNYLGYSLVEFGLKLDEAEEMIEKAVEQRPDDGYIVDSLGWVLYRLGDFDRAVEHLERAVELRPVDPVINDHFGDALWMVGRKIEAEFQWKRALSFEPEDKDAERIRRKLDVGLDIVLGEERELGLPGIIGRNENGTAGETPKDGG